MNITIPEARDQAQPDQAKPEAYDAVEPLILDLLEWIGSDAGGN